MEKNNTNTIEEIEENKSKTYQKKRHRKKSRETTKESLKTTIKTFFKEECKKDGNASTPTSAKKQSPPSTTKPQPKRINIQEMETKDSETDTSMDEDTPLES